MQKSGCKIKKVISHQKMQIHSPSIYFPDKILLYYLHSLGNEKEFSFRSLCLIIKNFEGQLKKAYRGSDKPF
jgi:hypothetical protein